MGNVTMKPRKPLSTGALIGLVFLLFFGIGFFRYLHGVLTENGEPPGFSILYGLLLAAWIGTGLFLLVRNALNQRRARELHPGGGEPEPDRPGDAPNNDPMRRLRDLESLKNDGLISEEEYRRKREELLREKW